MMTLKMNREICTIQVFEYSNPNERKANRLPSTVAWPGNDPTVVQTWFASVMFSYPGPCGTRVEQVPSRVWNSFVMIASNLLLKSGDKKKKKIKNMTEAHPYLKGFKLTSTRNEHCLIEYMKERRSH